MSRFQSVEEMMAAVEERLPAALDDLTNDLTDAERDHLLNIAHSVPHGTIQAEYAGGKSGLLNVIRHELKCSGDRAAYLADCFVTAIRVATDAALREGK